MKKNNHPFHLVEKSPWPIILSMSMMISTSGIVKMFNSKENYLMTIGMLISLMTLIQWWRDTIRESSYQGYHTKKVCNGIKMGMMLFIVSELMLFMSFFWMLFHNMLSPSIEIGMQWPPNNIKMFNPTSIPMLNTTILLTSGFSITWAHSAINSSNLTQFNKSMVLTNLLGMYFLFLQGFEYWESSFCISDSVYGSMFFLLTGFHGFHVIMGTMFNLITMKRGNMMQMSKNHFTGFECSCWYWHFVDVVWVFLYIMIYWWSK